MHIGRAFGAALLLAASTALAQQAPTTALNQITGVSASDGAVEIHCAGRPNFTSLNLQAPPRVVLDFADTVLAEKPHEIAASVSGLRGLRTEAFRSDTGAVARVVLTLDPDIDTDIVAAPGNVLKVKVLGAGSGKLIAKTSKLDFARADADAKARADAEAKARADADAKARDADSRAAAEAKSRADSEAKARAAAEAKAQQESKARVEAEAKAKSEADARAAAEAKARDAEAKLAKLEAERAAAEAKAQQESKARAQAEAEAKQERERQQQEAKLAADAKARADAAEKQRLAAEEQRKKEAAEAQQQARLAQEAIEKQRAESRARADAEAKLKAEQARKDAEQAERDRLAAESKARKEAEQAERDRLAAQRAEQARLDAEAAAQKKHDQDRARAQADAEARAEAKHLAEQREAERQARLAEARSAAVAQPIPPRGETRVASATPTDHVAVRAGLKDISLVGYRQEGQGGKVFIRANDAVRYSVSEASPTLLIVEVQDSRISQRNGALPLDTSFFAGPVSLVTPSEDKRDHLVKVEIKLKHRAAYSASLQGSEVVIDFPPE